MKRIALLFCLATCSVSLGIGCHPARHAVKEGGKKAGHETAEIASKGQSEVAHKSSDRYVGPQGQKLYVDGSSYYYVNERGKRVYVKQSKLRPK